MAKMLVRIYVSFGKVDGEELRNQYVIEDTKEAREALYEEKMAHCDDVYDSVDDFINGESDSLNGGLYGGDWDDPTGMAIVLYGKDELIAGIKADCESQIAEIVQLFEEAM